MVEQSRQFLVRVLDKYGRKLIEDQKSARSHRNAVMLVVNQMDLTPEYEVEVQELIKLPKSTYRIYEHTTREIEMKC